MRLRRLADRLVVLATSEQAGFLRKVPVDAESVVVEALHRWTPVERRWTLGELEDVTVDADPDRLALAIDALIENAVKHTRPEDAISISIRRRNGSAIIRVSDSGDGIPRRDLERIFDRFARSDAGRTRDGGGVGLGLAIVKAVVEAHGGSVSVQSEPGMGSEFELIVPATAPGDGGPAGRTASSRAAATERDR
jgi:signal transduction histidine kinase